jgi:putative RNA 2'-phosphotransferase
MNDASRTAASKFLSFVLRHQPEAIGVTLDPAGWVEVETLLRACAEHGRSLSRSELDEIVTTSAKQRFAFSEDGRRVRANQGHSTEVELGYEPAEPPAVLYHGTIASALPAIRQQGLSRMQRHHVHLSPDENTAQVVGARRGKPVILRIDARAMSAAGHQFYRSLNGVWLTAAVPPEFISGLDA